MRYLLNVQHRYRDHLVNVNLSSRDHVRFGFLGQIVLLVALLLDELLDLALYRKMGIILVFLRLAKAPLIERLLVSIHTRVLSVVETKVFLRVDSFQLFG